MVVEGHAGLGDAEENHDSFPNQGMLPKRRHGPKLNEPSEL